MPTFYFEVEETKKGWLRVEADTLEEARDDVEENGFDASNIIGSEEGQKEVTIVDGGEETD